LPIEFKREADVCDKCHKPNTEVGKLTDYTDPHDGYRRLLCSKCIEFREKPYKEVCPKCKRLAYKHGGMSFYGEPPYDDEDMCLECVERKEREVAERTAQKLKIVNFLKNNWKFWIATAIAILAGITGFIFR